MEKVKLPRKIQCNKDYNNTPSSTKRRGVFCSICNSKVIQISLKSILSGKAGDHKEAFLVVPLFKAAVVEQLQIVLNNEGDNIVLQALLKEDQSSYAAISVLERMDAFKSHMKGYDVLKGLRGQLVVTCQQFAYLIGNILRQCGIITPPPRWEVSCTPLLQTNSCGYRWFQSSARNAVP